MLLNCSAMPKELVDADERDDQMIGVL